MLTLCPPRERTSYFARLSRIDRADALDGVGRVAEALDEVRAVEKESPEPYAKAMALQAQGEYLARAGKFAEALPVLERAALLFPPQDHTVDSAFLWKWLGYVEARLGNLSRARQLFSQALSDLQVASQRPEAWLDVIRLQKELGLLGAADALALSRYPGLPAGFLRCLPPPTVTAPGELVIDLHRGEWQESGRIHWGLDLELRLAALLTLSLPWGMTAERLKPLLWPADLYSYSQLADRLRKLLTRIEKRLQATVIDRAGFLVLEGPPIQVIPGHGGGRPSFLDMDGRDSFTPGEAGDYYRLKRTQRAHVFQQWMDKKWVRREGSVARPVYRVEKA